MDKMQTLWSYYRELAEKCGIITDADGNEKETSYSIAWFYRGFPTDSLSASLNPLTRAFLGDEEALEQLDGDGAADLFGQDGIPALPTDTAVPDRLKDAILACCRGEQELNPSQILAIANALTRPITVIQGPPGTGKTETIKNLLLCLRSFLPEAKIAVASSNAEAIRNIEDLLKRSDRLRNSYAFLGRYKNRELFREKLDREDPETAELCASCTKQNGYTFPPVLLEHYPILFSTIHSLRKCIETDDTFDNQFDYVIVDECSQVGSMLGILAMASAKHLVLLGDDEQLAPIHHEEIRVTPLLHDLAEYAGPYYLDEAENSFMHACCTRFAGKAGMVFLNRHYRCHPGIIGFCNEYVYGGRLDVQTRDDGRFPVRIRWYAGDYWEQQSDEKGKKSNCNQKQIEIFLREEYPALLERMQREPGYSACVLSPYRRQLELLKAALDRCNADAGVQIEESELQREDPLTPDIPRLTIHKAQGRGYDYVCVMPVIDLGDNLWPQRKRITNVAVSRAKKELCYITSACWMPEWQQRRLVGYSVSGKNDTSEMYLRRLIDYVSVRQTAEAEQTGFGLVRTKLDSVFDRVPYYRQEKAPSAISAPELCVLNALWEETHRAGGALEGFELCREVPLQWMEGIRVDDTELQNYIDEGARFDIALCRNDRIHYLIEVDGALHRDPSETSRQKERDRLKDRAVAAISADFYSSRYVRIPTDGTTDHEIEAIEKAVKTAEEAGIITPILRAPDPGKKEKLRWAAPEEEPAQRKGTQMEYLKDQIEEIFRNFYDEMLQAPAENFSHIKKMNFSDGNLPDYGDLQQVRYYLLRYAMAYAFEYAVMYRIALSSLREEKNVTVYSFGCGSQIDGLALAYAKEKLLEADVSVGSLNYRGIDLVEWPVRFHLDCLNKADFHEAGMDEFMDDSAESGIRDMRCNILCFPKLLSENLDESADGGPSVIDRFCEGLKTHTLSRDRIVLCVSYRSRYTMEYDRPLAEKIIAALEENGFRLEKSAPLTDIPGMGLLADELETVGDGPHPCIVFRDEEKRCRELDPLFSLPLDIWRCLGVPGTIRKCCPDFDRLNGQETETSDPDADARPPYYCHDLPCGDDCIRSPITKVREICFQVLTFAKK